MRQQFSRLNQAAVKRFTQFELLIPISVLSILLSIGLPSFLDTFYEYRVVGAFE
jgi:Tfp pilus assembly protein FimT